MAKLNINATDIVAQLNHAAENDPFKHLPARVVDRFSRLVGRDMTGDLYAEVQAAAAEGKNPFMSFDELEDSSKAAYRRALSKAVQVAEPLNKFGYCAPAQIRLHQRLWFEKSIFSYHGLNAAWRMERVRKALAAAQHSGDSSFKSIETLTELELRMMASKVAREVKEGVDAGESIAAIFNKYYLDVPIDAL